MKIIWLISLISLLALGCSVKKPEDFLQDKPLYEHALALQEKGAYSDALPYWESLRNRFPRSPYVVEAELRLAEAYYETGEYASAEVSYRSFQSLHPTHEQIPFVHFQIAMTHFERMPKSIDRDQMQTRQALASFQEVARKYPNYAEIDEVQKQIKQCKKMLAERDLYVGNLYLRKRNYRASLVRLRALYGNTEFPQMQSEAAYKLGYAHYKLKEPDEARPFLAEVATNSEAGKYQKKAKKLLAKISK